MNVAWNWENVDVIIREETLEAILLRNVWILDKTGNLNDSISQVISRKPRWQTIKNNCLKTCDPDPMTLAELSEEDSP